MEKHYLKIENTHVKTLITFINEAFSWNKYLWHVFRLWNNIFNSCYNSKARRHISLLVLKELIAWNYNGKCRNVFFNCISVFHAVKNAYLFKKVQIRNIFFRLIPMTSVFVSHKKIVNPHNSIDKIYHM